MGKAPTSGLWGQLQLCVQLAVRWAASKPQLPPPPREFSLGEALRGADPGLSLSCMSLADDLTPESPRALVFSSKKGD